MNVNEKIERALINYLSEVHKIEAINAHFFTTNPGYDDGCDTCGYGSTEMSFDISYKLIGDKGFRTLTENGDPLEFLPILLDYDYKV